MSASAAGSSVQLPGRLASIIGPENVRAAGSAIIAAPADTQQIAEILRFAHTNELTVVPTGGGTKRSWGNPGTPDILLSLERMDRLREHTWEDMTCRVEAGCTWAAMQAELRRHGQMVALDPLWPEMATIGGIVATNDSGALRLKYGGLRDLIIGMTVVLVDGTIAKTGGKVVKNVAGYDLHKLMTGSFGTLSVIAEVNFRLHPVESTVLSYTVAAPDVSFFAAPVRALLESELTPSCLQFRIGDGVCCLDLHIASRPECMDEYGRRVRSIFSEMTVSTAGDDVWSAREALFADKNAVVLKISVLPADVCTLCAELQRRSFAPNLSISCVAQATGLITVALLGAPDAVVAAIESIRHRVQPSRGSVVVLQLPDALRGSVDVWGAPPAALPLMREIKRQFDPSRILNPGRFVGNI